LLGAPPRFFPYMGKSAKSGFAGLRYRSGLGLPAKTKPLQALARKTQGPRPAQASPGPAARFSRAGARLKTLSPDFSSPFECIPS
ncbi:MAG: hypothetical protein LBC67_01315, partial [Spirochaetales bacterium]|nr:hypothetical protein [Spirochaetales bacterium]